MISMRPATEEDIEAAALNPLPIFAKDVDHRPGCYFCLGSGWLVALVDHENNLCGVMGGFLIWRGVASGGALFTPHLLKYPVSAIRTARRSLEFGAAKYGLHRLDIAVQADYKIGHRWAKGLGFTAEGLLHKYGPNQEDHVMYGRTEWPHR